MNEESSWDEPDWDEDEFEDYTFDAPVKTVEEVPTKPTPISEENEAVQRNNEEEIETVIEEVNHDDLSAIRESVDNLIEELENEKEQFLPTWGYVVAFVVPAVVTFFVLFFQQSWTLTNSSIVALAVMNGSINSIIAILTIRLDGYSEEALDHLQTIMDEMDELESTLDEARTMVDSFTTDVGDAKEAFAKVGVDLKQLDLEPVSDVIESLKENKGDLNEILSNLRDVDVNYYITQMKSIEWDALFSGIQDVLQLASSKGTSTKSIPAPPKAEFKRNRTSIDATPKGGSEDLPLDELINESDWDEPTPTRLTLTRNKSTSLTLKRR